MKLIIRKEIPEDYRAVERLTREAFWNHYAPGCSEHYLAHILRESEAFVSELDFVAEKDGKIVGNIMYTRAQVRGDDQAVHPVLCFGPVSVLPDYQGQGIGTKLIEHTKRVAKGLGFPAIIIYGDPEYYKRVGFVPAEQFSIGTSWGTYAASLLACELEPGALNGCAGMFYEDDIYDLDEQKAEAFDREFEPKEKREGLPSQERLAYLVSQSKPRK